MKFNYYSLLYAMIGDTIGFGNGDVEFNYNINMEINKSDDINFLRSTTMLHIFKFISDGGYSQFSTKNLIVSDDSILLLAVYDAVISSLNKSNDFIVNMIKDKILEYYKNDKLKKKRYYGNTTVKSINKLINKNNWETFKYMPNGGGCGASIRCMPIGLVYFGEENRNKLLEISIQSSRITHNNPTAYLGGFATALFSALAMEKILPEKWLDILIDFFTDGIILNFVKKNIPNDKDFKYHKQDITEFNYLLLKYKNWRFIKVDNQYAFKSIKIKKKLYTRKSDIMIWLDERNKLFQEKFSRPNYYNPGSNGLDSVLLAYDSLLESGNNFEKLIYNAMLHGGDSDSTGCIAGALFGAYYGNANIPINLSKIELQKDLDKFFDKIDD